jgi:hypothetical protein
MNQHFVMRSEVIAAARREESWFFSLDYDTVRLILWKNQMAEVDSGQVCLLLRQSANGCDASQFLVLIAIWPFSVLYKLRAQRLTTGSRPFFRPHVALHRLIKCVFGAWNLMRKNLFFYSLALNLFS